METHKAFAYCASQYSLNTVIKNPSNAKEIWSRHGIQAWTSVSCFDHSCTKLLVNLGSPLTLKWTWIYALVISNQRTAGTLTFGKAMAVFSTVCHVLLYTAIFAFVHFPRTKGTMQKVKIWYICSAISPPPCQGIWCVVKIDWYIILIGSRKLLAAESWCLRYKYQWIAPYMKSGVWPFWGKWF